MGGEFGSLGLEGPEVEVVGLHYFWLFDGCLAERGSECRYHCGVLYGGYIGMMIGIH